MAVLRMARQQVEVQQTQQTSISPGLDRLIPALLNTMNNYQLLEKGVNENSLKINKRMVQSEEFYIKCETCGKEITGTSEKRVEWNYQLHRKQAHPLEFARDMKRKVAG